VGGQVKDSVGAGRSHTGFDRVAVEQIERADVHRLGEVVQPPGRALGPHPGNDVMAFPREAGREIGADEAAGPCD
jgi:hypothetical protein